jgi:hypothetical protein
MLFIYTFYALCGICILLYIYTKAKLATTEDAQFIGFQRSYLTIYLLAVGK